MMSSLENKVVGPPKWRSGLRHCIAVLEVSLQTWVRSQAVLQPAVTRSLMRRRTDGPADFGHQLDGVSSNTLVQLPG
jgi:hypothetical protein